MSVSLFQAGRKAAIRLTVLSILLFTGLLVGITSVISTPTVPIGIVSVAGIFLLWVLPDLRTTPERIVRILFLPFVAVTLSVPNYYGIVGAGIPWISIRRVFLYALIAVTLVTLAGSSEKRALVAAKLRAAPWISFFLIGFLVVSTLSTLQSVQVSVSLNDLLNMTLNWYVPLLAGLLYIRSPQDVTRLLYVILACMLIDAVLGGVEYYLRRPFLIYALPAWMREALVAQNPWFSNLVVGTVRGNDFRASSIFNTTLSWGEMSGMLAPLAAYFAVQPEWRRKVFGLVSLAGCVASVVFAGARGGYACLLVDLCVFLLLWSLVLVVRRPQSLAGAIMLTLMVTFVTAAMPAVFFVHRIHNKVLGGYESQSSDEGRNQQWQLGWPKIASRPVLGYGLGTATNEVGWTDGAGNLSLDSYVLSLLVSTGILGCACFFGFLFSAITASGRLELQSLTLGGAGIAVASTLVGFVIYRFKLAQTENNILVFVLVSVVICLRYQAFGSLARYSPTSRFARASGHKA